MKRSRYDILQLFVLTVFVLLALRLLWIQTIDDSYKDAADNNVLRHEILYPPRGEVYDRYGEFLVQSEAAYDLMFVPREGVAFDTMRLCALIDLTPEQLARQLKKAASYSWRRPSVIVKQLPQETKLRLDEAAFPGFYTVYRTTRHYPRKIAGNLLGYVGEVNDAVLARDDYYRAGDYIGMSGLEQAYETVLRGDKGAKINLVDVHGTVQGPYHDGAFDTPMRPGTSITTTIDAGLQELAEQLMEGKVGSVVAIEPATGEILVMASSPTYDPDELLGRQRGNRYMELLANPRHPLFNRAVMAAYPPGSTFKIVNGLIGLQEGVLHENDRHPCHRGYTVGRGVKCHEHPSPVDLHKAVQMSCNAYFCYVLRDILDNPALGGIRNGGFDTWADYVRSFGFGRRLESDFLGERNGYVPDAAFYDRGYRGYWNSLTVLSLAIGQGELGCTPLQMANLAATVANRGYYYIPHVVRRIHDRDSIDPRFYERHYTKVDPVHFAPIVEGMYDAVHREKGTAQIARVEGLDLCGKTGTAQNPHGRDHSTFMCFAPKDDPKIAVSVYVENGGWGGSVAAPIASLLVERYLTDTIRRPALVDYIRNLEIAYPAYDRVRQ